jgi:hypothetical protein
MNILILNNSPHIGNPYEEWLSDLADGLILLTSDPYNEDFQGYLYKESFRDYESSGLIELRAVELYQKYQYKQVIALNEWDILRAGQIRDRFGLKGQGVESATIFRNKVKMKEHAQKSGVSIRIPAFKEIYHPFELIDFIDQQGYPIVVKPLAGAGSRNTEKINNHTELERFLEHPLIYPFLAEEFIDGDMYHIDGLVLQGEIVFIWPSKYINGCLAYQDSKYLGSYALDEENPLRIRLQEATRELLQLFPTPEHTTFHAEIFHTPDDQFYFCEIASRTGGAKVNESIERAFGINLSKLWARALCGHVPDLEQFKGIKKRIATGFVLLPPKAGTIAKINKNVPFEWVIQQEYNADVGDTFYGAKRSVDQIALFTVRGDSEHQVVERIDQVAQWFEQETIYR